MYSQKVINSHTLIVLLSCIFIIITILTSIDEVSAGKKKPRPKWSLGYQEHCGRDVKLQCNMYKHLYCDDKTATCLCDSRPNNVKIWEPKRVYKDIYADNPGANIGYCVGIENNICLKLLTECATGLKCVQKNQTMALCERPKED